MKTYCATSSPELTDGQIERLEKLGEVSVADCRKLSEDEFIERFSDAEILIVGSSGVEVISRKVLEGLPKLKFLSLLTVGTAWVDLDYANETNLPVSNIKGANAQSVAEHTWAMILNLSKRVSEADRNLRNGGEYKFLEYQGIEIIGKSLGVIGLGDIGKQVAQIGSAFGMSVIGVNKSGKEVENVRLVELKELLNKSDVITICTPLTEETTDLISDEEFHQMKGGVILVNPAREAIVNKKAVLKNIESGKLRGYGIETEIMVPVDKDDEYFNYDNVIVTPHTAFFTVESDAKSFEMAVANVENYFSQKSTNIVT